MKTWLTALALGGSLVAFGCSSNDSAQTAGGDGGDGSAAGGHGTHGGASSSNGGHGAVGGGGDGGGSPQPSVTGVDKVLTGEYVTSYLKDGHLYGLGGTYARLGAGDHPPNHVFPPPQVDLPADSVVVDGAGGLHFQIAADDKGRVFEWGDIDANPDLGKHNSPIQITTDFEGKDFNVNAGGAHVRAMIANGATNMVVKGDGTVWIWDDTSGGLQGDGTDGSSSTLKPVRVDIPLKAGVTIEKIALSDVAVALDSEGVLWTWGGNNVPENLGNGQKDYKTPHAITKTKTGEAMPKVTQVVGGSGYYYALTESHDVYAWGLYLETVGNCPGSGWCPEALPAKQTAIFADLPASAHVESIFSSSGGAYVILSDGSLWGWGTDGQGLVGDGVEWACTDKNPTCSWDWNKDEMIVQKAVHIAPDVHNFKTVFSGSGLVFYAYALTDDGRLYSWGRNKTADLGNGILPRNSQQAAAYPNSWDVTVPTEVNPFTAVDTPTDSPVCVKDPKADSCWCGGNQSGPQNC